MAAVLLTILKIIGIIVLSIIALVLLLISIVLFVPVRYKVIADKSKDSDDFYLNVNISFLLHILSATFRYDKDLYKAVKVFGIKIWPAKKKSKKNTAGSKPVTDEPESYESSSVQEENQDTLKPDDFTVDWNEDTDDKEEETGPEDIDDTSDLYQKIEKIIETIVSKIESLSEKYDRIKKELRFWDKMINDTRNRNAALLLKKWLIRLLKAIRPRKIKGFIHFGFEDPATCGKVLMYLSIVYPTLPRKLVFEPSFEDTDIYGDVLVKGRIFLIVFAVCLIRLYFDKDIKRMLSLYKKHQNR